MTERNENTLRAPPDTTFSSWRSWKDIEADREKPPIGWKQDMKDKYRVKKQDKKMQHHCAAKTMAQQTLSLLEYEMYNLEMKALQEEIKRATQVEELGQRNNNDAPAPMPLPLIWPKQEDGSNTDIIAFAGNGYTWSKEELKE